MFRGFNPINLDDKGRMAVPTRYRSELRECCGQQLVMTVSPDRCLLLYPLPEWEIVENKINKLPSFNRHTKSFQRLLIGYATDCEMDGQGRVLIAEPLRRFACLEKRVVLVGQGNKFEIWNEDVWNSHSAQWLDDANLTGLAELPPNLSDFSY